MFFNDDEMSNAYNRFTNLDGIEDRIIYYLISPIGKSEAQLKQVHTIWKILKYDDVNALNNPLPSFSEVAALIENENAEETDKRIFREPHLSDAWLVECSMIKIYVDSVIPVNNMLSVVNVGIDILTHNKLTNVKVPEDDDSTIIDVVDGVEIKVNTKNRVTVLLKAVLSLLNGADIAGIGKMQFNGELSRFNQARYAVWNNRNFSGQKCVIGCQMSGVG